MRNNIFPSGQSTAITPAPAVDLTPHQMQVRSDLVSYFALGGTIIGLAIGIMNYPKKH